VNHTPDDPYYCGLRARVPNFVSKATNGRASRAVDNNSNYITNNNLNKIVKDKEHKKMSAVVAPLSTFHQKHGNNNNRDLYLPHQPQLPPAHHQQHYNMWHAKSYESGIGEIFF
jgi:hypothetical protein